MQLASCSQTAELVRNRMRLQMEGKEGGRRETGGIEMPAKRTGSQWDREAERDVEKRCRKLKYKV